jgi:PKD domain
MFRSVRPAPLALLTVLALLGVNGSAGAEGLLAPETLSAGAASSPQVAMAPNGYAAAAWEEDVGGGQFAVGVATRPPGGPWSRAQLLNPDANNKFSIGVAIDAGGDAAVSWEEIVTPNALSFVASRAGGGAFTRPEQLNDAVSVSSPTVGVDANGRVTLVYNPYPTIVARDFQAGASALAAAPQLLASGSPDSCFGGQLAVSPTGDAVAAWSCGGAQFALRRAGAWNVSPPIANDEHPCPSISTTNSPSDVAIDSQGHAAALLTTSVVDTTAAFDPTFCFIFSRETDTVRLVLPVGGFMTPLVAPVATGTASFGSAIAWPQVGVAPSGVVAAWLAPDAMSAFHVHVRDFTVDGAPSGAETTIDPDSPVAFQQLAVGGDGRALLTWARRPSFGVPLPLEVASRPPGGTFGAPAEVTADGSQSALLTAVLDDGGDGVLGFVNDTAPKLMHVRGFDAAPPTLSGVSIPATAALAAPVAFSVAPFDVWGLGTTTWSFGDGATATGPSVTHAYARAGSFTASVTSTDAVGNAATRSGVVQVSAPAAAAGGAGGPSISGLSLTHRRFRVGRAPTAISARRRARRAPVGTTFRFKLDRDASVRIAIERPLRGLRSGRRCLAPSRRLRRAGARRCTRRGVLLPALTRASHAGANAVPFSGRLGRRALRPGRYRALLTPTADGRAGAPSGVRFRVVR